MPMQATLAIVANAEKLFEAAFDVPATPWHEQSVLLCTRSVTHVENDTTAVTALGGSMSRLRQLQLSCVRR